MCAERVLDLFEVCSSLGESLSLLSDAVVGAEDGGVVTAAKNTADLGDAVRSELAEQVYRDVAGVGDVAGAGRTGQLVLRQPEVLADCAEDCFSGEAGG